MAGEPITAKQTRASGNNEPIGGLKVTTENAWFAARHHPVPKISTKSTPKASRGEAHLEQVLEEARAIVSDALGA